MEVFNSVINTNTYSPTANFRGKHIKCLEFHDVYEGQRYRNYLREHLFPYFDIYEKECNKTEHEMEMILYNLYEKNELLNSIGLNKLKYIGNNSYRGAMVRDYNLDKLQKLKEAGIKHIIDLEGYPETETECKKLGLDYSYFHISYLDEACWPSYVMSGELYRSRNEYYARIRKFFPERNRYSSESCYVEIRKFSDYDQHCKMTIEKLIKFVQTMQDGNVYIGCDHGTDFTDAALLIDYVFNPQAKHDSCITEYSRNYLVTHLCGTRYEPLYALRYKLIREDYQRMGWYISPEDSHGERLRIQMGDKIDSLIDFASGIHSRGYWIRVG